MFCIKLEYELDKDVVDIRLCFDLLDNINEYVIETKKRICEVNRKQFDSERLIVERIAHQKKIDEEKIVVDNEASKVHVVKVERERTEKHSFEL